VRRVQVITGFIMGTLMSFLMSGFITAVSTGIGAGFVGRWAIAFPLAWLAAVPLAILFTPWTLTVAERLSKPGH
jgi:hypothetical protein